MNKFKLGIIAIFFIFSISLVGCKKNNTYSVVFKDYNGTVLKEEIVKENHSATAPEDPIRNGYEFIGWSVDFSNVTKNLVVMAKYKDVTEYRITLNANGGIIEENTIYYTNYNEVTLPIPTKENYIFLGWYQKDELVENITENKNISLTAKWKGKEFNIKYELNGGIFEGEYPVTYEYGTYLALVPASKDGYGFVGWYKDKDFNGSVVSYLMQENGEIMLYARFEKSVVYNLNGGNWNYKTREQVVSDFLKDSLAWANKTSKPDGMKSGLNETSLGFANVFSSIYGFFSSEKYGTKWTWLKEYLIDATDNATTKSELTKGSEVYWRYTLGAFLFEEYNSTYPQTENFTKTDKANDFWIYLSNGSTKEFVVNENDSVKEPVRIYYVFDGWFDNPEFNGEKITSLNKTITLYAKWIEEVPVESITMTNKKSEFDRFEKYQLEWSLNPSNAAIKRVAFTSSNPEIATVSDSGLITCLQNGSVTITIISLSPSGKEDSFTINITSPDHFDISYETNSYTTVNESIKLNAEYIKRDNSKPLVLFESLDPSIATVSSSGNVLGISEGVATIRASVDGESNTYVDFKVTVLSNNLSKELKHIIDSHESNVFTRYDLGIGSGTPVYYANIFGSVSTLLYNYEITWNTKYLEDMMKKGSQAYVSGLDKVEFITVHYTAGMTEGSNAEATASYFVNTQNRVSAHFCTGNDGVFQCLELNVKGYHAGDGTENAFKWFDTGVAYNEDDPMWPEWGISENAMFTINGKETLIKVPLKEERGNEGYVTDSKWLNDQGFAFKIVDGNYYMGTTWWCYSNVWEGRICSKGGNSNSIGIESAVDYGSDLWLTWQITAKLVASLMVEYDLDITRVVGHHFFAAKDCPQPLLENNLEIWWEFIELVKTEYETLTNYKDTNFEFTVTSGENIVNEYGRIIEQPEFSQIITYEVKLDDGTKVTLATSVPGIYTK